MVAFQDTIKVQLQENGPMIGRPYWESVGDGLGEIRWNGNRTKLRLYGSIEGKEIVLYLGVVKKWKTLRNQDRKTCIRYRTDFRSKDYDYEKRELESRAYYEGREKR
jgi:hypothetical protein